MNKIALAFILSLVSLSVSAAENGVPATLPNLKLVKVTPLYKTVAKAVCSQNLAGQKVECINQYSQVVAGYQAIYQIIKQ